MPNQEHPEDHEEREKLRERGSKLLGRVLGTAGFGLAIGAVAMFHGWRNYHVCEPFERIAITGLGIKGIRIRNKIFRFPGQKVYKFSLTPTTVKFHLNGARDANYLPFDLPGSCIVMPRDDDESLALFATRIASGGDIANFVRSAIEGSIRVQVASMSIEQLFNDRAAIHKHVTSYLEAELKTFGLQCLQVQLQELEDTADTSYFKDRSTRALQETHALAAVHLAEAKAAAATGEKQTMSESRQKVAEFEAKALLSENLRQNEIAESTANLQKKQAEYDRQINIARLEAEKAATLRDIELQIQVEQRRQEQQVASERAGSLSVAQVHAQVQEEQAKGERLALMQQVTAEVDRRRQFAEADLAVALKRAEGVKAVAEAEAAGLRSVVGAFNGDSRAALVSIMLRDGVLPDLAKANAEAVKGMNPSLNIWSTGGASGDSSSIGGGGGLSGALRDVGASVPPLLDCLDRAGIELPKWLPQKKGNNNNTNVSAEDYEKMAQFLKESSSTIETGNNNNNNNDDEVEASTEKKK